MGQALRVLLVDDYLDNNLTLAALLEAWGHEVRTATTGAEALLIAAHYRTQVVLLDLGLPGMTGLEVGRRLREQAGTPPPRLIACTGHAEEQIRVRCREAGFDDFLVKPTALDKLEHLLHDAATACSDH